MASESTAALRQILASALEEYHASTGVDLRSVSNNPEWAVVFLCTSTAEILDALDTSMARFSDFRDARSKRPWKRVRERLGGFTETLLVFNAALSELASSLNAPGGRAIFVAFGILLQATKANDERLDKVDELFSKLHAFFERLHIYLKTPVWVHLRGTFVKTIGLLLRCLSIATKEISRKRHERLKDAVLGSTSDLGQALHDMDVLTSEEHLKVSALTLTTLVEAIPQILTQYRAFPENMVLADASGNVSLVSAGRQSNHGSVTVVAQSTTTLQAHTAETKPPNAVVPFSEDEGIRALIIEGDRDLLLAVVAAATVFAANGTTRAALATAFLCWFYRTVFSIQRTGVVFGRVVFIDAFGERFSILASDCCTPEKFHEFLLRISERPEKRSCRRYVLAREYHVEDTSNGGIIPSESWNIEPRMCIELAIKVKAENSICPWCQRAVSASKMDNGRALFECCARQFSVATVTEVPLNVAQPMGPEPPEETSSVDGFHKLHVSVTARGRADEVKPIRRTDPIPATKPTTSSSPVPTVAAGGKRKRSRSPKRRTHADNANKTVAPLDPHEYFGRPLPDILAIGNKIVYTSGGGWLDSRDRRKRR